MKASCGGCAVTWAGDTARAHCGVCHMTFSSPKTFDKHRWAHARGHGCNTPESVGLVLQGETWYALTEIKEV